MMVKTLSRGFRKKLQAVRKSFNCVKWNNSPKKLTNSCSEVPKYDLTRIKKWIIKATDESEVLIIGYNNIKGPIAKLMFNLSLARL